MHIRELSALSRRSCDAARHGMAGQLSRICDRHYNYAQLRNAPCAIAIGVHCIRRSCLRPALLSEALVSCLSEA